MSTVYYLQCEMCQEGFASENIWEMFCAGCIATTEPLVQHILRKTSESPYFYQEYLSFVELPQE